MDLQNHTLLLQTSRRVPTASLTRGPFPSPPRPWSSTEDQMLVHLMKSGSRRDWDTIIKRLPNRTKGACEFRYEKLKQNGSRTKHHTFEARPRFTWLRAQGIEMCNGWSHFSPLDQSSHASPCSLKSRQYVLSSEFNPFYYMLKSACCATYFKLPVIVERSYPFTFCFTACLLG